LATNDQVEVTAVDQAVEKGQFTQLLSCE